MKISGAKKVHYDSGPNMTPLVDVVMVILIFLMLAGSFTAEKLLVSDVATAEKGVGGKADPNKAIKPEFTIKVSQDGPFYVAKAGNFAQVNSRDPGKAYDQLYSELKAQLNEFISTGVKPEEVQIKIQPSVQVTMDNLVVVWQAASDAGFKQIGFAAPN